MDISPAVYRVFSTPFAKVPHLCAAYEMQLHVQGIGLMPEGADPVTDKAEILSAIDGLLMPASEWERARELPDDKFRQFCSDHAYIVLHSVEHAWGLFGGLRDPQGLIAEEIVCRLDAARKADAA